MPRGRAYLRFAPAIVLVVLLGDCATQPPALPYDGLTPTSYGPLQSIPPQSCSPNAQGAGAGIAELSRQMTALIMTPLSGISKVDPKIQEEQLADNFKIPGDPGAPPVTILARSDNGIVFWHMLDLIPLSETGAAAQTFCARRGRRAVWQGSAERCGTPTTIGIAVNGQQPVSIPSQVISSYQCVLSGTRPGPQHRAP